MAEELERLWSKLSFTEEEDEGIELDFNCTKAAREIGKNCALMKILAHKSISIKLVLLQEFNGKLTPKEVEIRWAPFWVQIFNLPLNCRTKEIGLAIGAKLGEVLEIDVQESGVHWGTCLRVKVHLDVTKRLLRGKKITMEGGESRWVNFKYERLPNFCYQCGLLNHTLKECPKNGEGNKSTKR
ncbi:uncharacterized protein LOC115973328 [Quercus lobata]|uniref:uncharacterized protein LOC115973328 n=1 Tax=Quercus lobata TaxID=97700 RepID=UPI0012447E24|nr:uncharacterized protein LOC115973328 [Quercus lobata]